MYISLLLLVLFPTGTLAQTTIGDIDPPSSEHPITSLPNGTNMISCSEYDAITYNGYTIGEIAATDGEASQVKQLWGNYTSVETTDIVAIAKYHYNDNRISFRESELTGLTIKEPDWPVAVLGENINVGDTFAELQQKFGNDLKIIHKPDINSNYAVSFTCNTIDAQGILVYLSTDTNTVLKITFYIST